MNYRGIIRGQSIVFDHDLPYTDGTVVTISIECADTEERGTGAAVPRAVQAPPSLAPGDVDELDRAIESAVRDEQLLGPDPPRV